MRTRAWLTGVAGGALLLGGIVASSPFQGAAMQDATPQAQTQEQGDDAAATPVVGTPLLTPTIDLATAQRTALDGQSGAVVTSIKLDGDDGTLIYEITLDDGTEVEVDATSGAVLPPGPNGDDDAEGDDDANDDDGGDHEDGGSDQGDDDDEGDDN